VLQLLCSNLSVTRKGKSLCEDTAKKMTRGRGSSFGTVQYIALGIRDQQPWVQHAT